ncbi:MAG: hypothetical protein IKO95_08030 [Spirochaetia bacterium]|nr:hypothetical protein [Spirochaetia bacterium]
MNYEDLFKKSGEENERITLLNLYKKWRKIPNINNDSFTADGFYPGYFSAKHKVLFIGREPRYAQKTGDKDRVTFDLAWFEKTLIEKKGLGAYWKRIYTLDDLIQAEKPVQNNLIKDAKTILARRKENNNYGIAIINISKYINEDEKSSGNKSNIKQINTFLKTPNNINFIRDEIMLLNPDIIIHANLWGCGIDRDYLNQIFPYLEKLGEEGSVILSDFRFNANNKPIKFIQTYHFSARKNPKNHFYDPVMKLLSKYYF